MTYRVKLMPQAEADIERIYRWVVSETPLRGSEWFNGLVEAIGTLSHNPERSAPAPESPLFEEPIRQLVYGKRSGRYRVLFRVRGETVEVLHVRHGARRRVRLRPAGETTW